MRISIRAIAIAMVQLSSFLLSVSSVPVSASDTALSVWISPTQYNVGDAVFVTPNLYYTSGSSSTFSGSITISGLEPFDIDQLYAFPLPYSCTQYINSVTCSASGIDTSESLNINLRLIARSPGEYTISISSSPKGENTENNDEYFTIYVNDPPQISILEPLDESIVLADIPVLLDATAVDAEDGDLTPLLKWKSNIDGPIGVSSDTVVLTPGRHTLTAYVEDSQQVSASAETHMVVGEVQAATPIIKTFIGTSESGYVDSSNPADARFGGLGGIAYTPQGEIYLIDNSNKAIRKVDPDGTVASVLTGPMYVRNQRLMADSFGNIYWWNNDAKSIYRMTTGGSVNGFAGGGYYTPADGMVAAEANFDRLGGLASGPNGDVYLSLDLANKVFRIDQQGYLNLITGSGSACTSPVDGEPAVQQTICYPGSLAVDSLGNVYIAQNSSSGGSRIYRVSTDGLLSLVAGGGEHQLDSDHASALEAHLNYVSNVMVNDQDELLFVENATLRKVDRFGILTTLYGNGLAEDSGDGGFAAEAGISGGSWVIAGNGDLLITQGSRVRVITREEQQSDYAVSANIPGVLNQFTPAIAELEVSNQYSEERALVLVDVVSTDMVSVADDSCLTLGDTHIRCVVRGLAPGEVANIQLQMENMNLGLQELSVTVSDYFSELSPQDNQAVLSYSVNGAPTLNVISPMDGQTFSTVDLISFSATASDPDDGDVSMNIAWVSNIDGALSTGSSFTAQLSAGNQLITAIVVDSAGIEVSYSLNILVEQYNSAPSVVIVAPVEGSSISEDDGPISFVADISDAESALSELNVVWESSLDGIFDAAQAVLSPGDHAITVTVTDPGGMSASAGLALTITPHQNVKPVITLSGDGLTVDNKDPINLDVVATDQEDGDLSGSVLLTSSLDGPITLPAMLSVGVHTITASVTDSDGASASVAIILTVTEFVNSAPSVQFVSPMDGSEWFNNNLVTFSVFMEDAEGEDVSASLVFESSLDGTITSPTLLSVGVHIITATVTDSYGASGSDSISLSVIPGVNQPPTISILSPTDGQVIAEQTALVLTAVASDSEDGNLNASVVWNSSLDGAIESPANLSVGVHLITAQVTDSNGQSTSATVEVTVEPDSTGPVYCTAAGNNQNYEWIESVSFAGETITSGRGSGYTDNSGMEFPVTAGETIPVILVPGFSSGSYTEYWELWIDTNNNGVFETSELSFSASGATSQTGSVVIPDGFEGAFRMRIVMHYGSNVLTNGCGSFSYGEVEDYTVVVTGESGGNTMEISLTPDYRAQLESSYSTSDEYAWVTEEESQIVDVTPIYDGLNFYQQYAYENLQVGRNYRVWLQDINGQIVSNIVAFTYINEGTSLPELCESSGSSSNLEWIESIQFGAQQFNSGNDGGYIDHSSESPVLLTSLIVSPTFTVGGNYSEYWSVWIDINKDGTLDSTEQIDTFSGRGALTRQWSLPAELEQGQFRMRVSMKYGGVPAPCGSFTWGEVEDFLIEVE